MSFISNDMLHFYIIAGEASGDQIGARLIKALKIKEPSAVISGIGGPEMEKQKLSSLFPMSELSIMGIFEVLPHLIKLFKRLKQTEEDIVRKNPDIVITIDSPGFNFRLAKKLKKKGIPVVHYGAPSVWAWRPKRAKKISKFLTHLFTLFPFEPIYFTTQGLNTTFVGHPLIEMNISSRLGEKFRKDYGYDNSRFILSLLPGSRLSEIKKLLPIFLKVVENLKKRYPDLVIVLPTLPHLKLQIQSICHQYSSHSFQFIEDSELKFAAMAASNVSLAASGTVALELALTETPMVIAYKINPLTALILKFLLKIPYVSLVNILLKKVLVPELLQENCTVEKIEQVLIAQLENPCQKAEFPIIRQLLTNVESDLTSSEQVAVKVIEIARQKY